MVPWWALAGLFALSEVSVVHVEFRGDAHTFSMNEILLVVGLFLATPSDLVLAQLIGAGAVLVVYRRQRPIKLLFNLANLCLQACLAIVVFRMVVGSAGPSDPQGWLAAIIVAWLALLTSDVLINAAITLSGGNVPQDERARLLTIGAVGTATNSSIGLITATILSTRPSAAVLLFVPTAVALATYRLYLAGRRYEDRLETMRSSSLTAQGSMGHDATVQSLLDQARRMFVAELAEIAIFPSAEGENTDVLTLGADDRLRRTAVRSGAESVLWTRVRALEAGVLVTPAESDHRVSIECDVRGIRDAMVVPIHADGTTAAVLVVANRLGDLRTFDAWDLRVCETLGSSIGLSVESARVADLTRTVEGLAELNQVKDDFVAMVSHELRAPLTSIRGCVSTLLRDDLVLAPEDHHGFLRAIERQSLRLQKMIEDLLVVSRLESGTGPSEVRQVSVQGLLDQVLEGLAEAITGHALVLRLPEPLPKLRVDNYKVSQILSNVIENACKYSPEGSTVPVSARADPRGIDISVENGGEGIPEHAQTRVFDRFFRVDDQGRAGPGGMGLGLYICRRLSEAIGAELRLDRSDARGTVFTLRLPLKTPTSEGIRPRLAAVE